MQIYCEGCRKPQSGTERTCSSCGRPFGGEWFILVTGLLLATSLPSVIWFSNQPEAVFDPRIIFWYELPVLVGTAFLYDYHPRRRAFYFWGGAAGILASLFVLAK